MIEFPLRMVAECLTNVVLVLAILALHNRIRRLENLLEEIRLMQKAYKMNLNSQ